MHLKWRRLHKGSDRRCQDAQVQRCSLAERPRMAVKIKPAGSWEVFILSSSARGWIILLDLWRALQAPTCMRTNIRQSAHTESRLCPTRRLFVICSLSALFAWIIWKLHLLMPLQRRQEGGQSKNSTRASWHADVLLQRGWGGLLNHKTNRWCESWILNTKESITVCFKTVNCFEKGAVQLLLVSWDHDLDLPLSGGRVFACFLYFFFCFEQKQKKKTLIDVDTFKKLRWFLTKLCCFPWKKGCTSCFLFSFCSQLH